MELTPWNFAFGTYTMEGTLRNLHHRCSLMELTSLKVST